MTTITIDKAVLEQALKALEHSHATEPIWKTPIKEAITALRQAMEQPAQHECASPMACSGVDKCVYRAARRSTAPVDHAVIAGALFDFLGWLTSRQQRVTWSSCDDATTAIDAVIEFAKMRGLSLDEVHVLDWQDRIQAEEVPPWPVIDKSAAIRIATALGWEPKREPLTDEQIEDLYFDGFSISNLKEFARAIEAAHGITGEKK